MEGVAQAYIEGWRLGLKAPAIYREGSKESQSLSTSVEGERKAKENPSIRAKPFRRHLPDTRASITHKFSVSGHEGYITVCLHADGRPGELFIPVAKSIAAFFSRWPGIQFIPGYREKNAPSRDSGKNGVHAPYRPGSGMRQRVPCSP